VIDTPRHRTTRARRPAVVLLARRPRLGGVKRRLAAGLGAPAALALHRAFLLDTLRWLARLPRRRWEVRVEWSEPFRPDLPLARALRGAPTGVQAPGNLGRRIDAALRRRLADGAPCALAIGADSPHLGEDALRRALRCLGRCEVVLGPAEDGGYYLIGARRVDRRWFEGVDWGTGRVLRQTLARLRRGRARVALVGQGYDLDTVDSLRRLRRALSRSAALRRRLPATRRLLGEIDLTAAAQRCWQR
jgi:rSAM/selenodomain-associated transferase 1